MKKKLLVYAHYYPPDVASTGQLLQDLAEGMSSVFDVTVICTVPSYTGKIDEAYRDRRFYREELGGVHVLRVPVPEFSKSDRKSRIRNLLTYYFKARRATKITGRQDYVLAISQPPIMGGMLGVYGKKQLGARLIYCIQDFNPEQIMATGYINLKPALKAAMWLDMRSCRKADLIITVGRDLCETLEKRFMGKAVPKYIMINNWIDEKTICPLPADDPGVSKFRNEYGLDGRFIFMYSGNIGLYYDLDGLIHVIERFRDLKTPDGREVVFAFVGSGSMLDKLKQYRREQDLKNVVFIPYQEKEKLIYSLNAADVHWCVNAKGIKGVSCPSKFYGIAGVAKPVLAVLEEKSEIQMLIQEIGCGRCSEPGEYEAIAENIRWFVDHAGTDELSEMGRKGREYLLKHLSKDDSIEKYIKVIDSL
ncbi:MAG: glycosyltransferase family 4 protein [Clostridiales bacterium]|nr:glycosyltransferase family 4 protein [Clostridiales bacterium]